MIIKQIKGECRSNDPKLEKDFEVLGRQYVPHANNVVADDLLTKASMWAPVPDGIFERRLQ
jgi:hypothetical protein